MDGQRRDDRLSPAGPVAPNHLVHDARQRRPSLRPHLRAAADGADRCALRARVSRLRPARRPTFLATINTAALAAYQALRREFPGKPIGILGESIGSGPASFLASASPAPDKIILVVPFDTLADVAARHFPFLPVRLMLRDRWDNIAALRNYPGPIDIYGALDDEIINFAHAKNLSARIPAARFTAIEGGHNSWSASPQVKISR